MRTPDALWRVSGAVVARYSQTENVDEPLAMLRAGATSFYEQDGLGSVTSLTNAAGALAQTYTYDSVGNLTASAGQITNPFQYTAREFDSETGLYYYRARYYDPTTGRFLSEDPMRFAAGTNFYAYVKNNPVNFYDPLGLLAPCNQAKCLKGLKEAKKDLTAVRRAEAAWSTLQAAADANEIDPALLAAIGVRESGFLNGKESDGAGVGVGVFQITVSGDSGITTTEAGQLSWAANYAAEMLATNMAFLAGAHPNFTPSQLLQAVAATYNMGLGKPRGSNISGNPDRIDVGTTGGNYGANVLLLMYCF